VRDRRGRHTLDPDACRAAIAAVHGAVGDRMVVQLSTEARGTYSPAEQMAVVRAVRPEAVSLAVRELVPDEGSEHEAAAFFAWLEAERIAPQYILYSPDDLARFRVLRRRGVVPGRRPFVLFVLGRYAADRESDPRDLLPFLAPAPGEEEELAWAVCAFGRLEAACVLAAAALGGHARVGFENNLLLADGRTAPDNAALVTQLVAGLRAMGRPVADAAAARALLA
jgi:uncharacterized protein (DUF849 family)